MIIIVDGIKYYEDERLRRRGPTKCVPFFQSGKHLGFIEIAADDKRSEVIMPRPWADYNPISEDYEKRYAANPHYYAGD